MYELNASVYHETIVLLQQAIALSHSMPVNQQITKMTRDNRSDSAGLLERIEKVIESLPIPVTKLTLQDLKETLKDDPRLDYLGCGNLMLALSNNLRRELHTVKMFNLDTSRVPFYQPKEPLFGTEVAAKFQECAYEIDQGGKCYACDLTTAAAFHWIRALEGGVHAITECLGIPGPTKGRDRNWSNILSSIKNEIDKRWPASTGRMAGDAKLFDKLYGALAGMQNPYRNETMHLDAKYTAPEALHIFELAKGLMQQIAARMDENGEPKI